MNQGQQRRTAARRRRATRRRITLSAVVAVVAIVTLSVVLATSANESGEAPLPTETVLAVPPGTAAQPYITETDPLTKQNEREPIESPAEPAPDETTTFVSDEIPLSYELQKIMWAECDRWGCPYALALAVAEVESQFNMEAVGAVGEVGIMQLNPGPSGFYHDELEATTGLDPTTPEGNISGGVYLLGAFMELYSDPTKAAMAYNMGQSGALKAWAAGITTSTHAEKVLAAMEYWEAVLADLEGGPK